MIHLPRLLMSLVLSVACLPGVAIAVPLKYLAGQPEMVRVVGLAHGLLFLWATATLGVVMVRGHLPVGQGTRVFAASLIPFAGLWSHRLLNRRVATYGRPGPWGR